MEHIANHVIIVWGNKYPGWILYYTCTVTCIQKYACRSCTSTNALTSSYNNNNNNYIEKLVIIM